MLRLSTAHVILLLGTMNIGLVFSDNVSNISASFCNQEKNVAFGSAGDVTKDNQKSLLLVFDATGKLIKFE